ncbi:uncharacterized protein LOC128876288 [Hylaeus volcanicus]|uniref:uncharacterized protein LOC128876288 n=1 Tax=Hylaeus volcanicus TaxID=313075 RepID=UPI0023B82071|nr:uncharacterized protein LOC128876288 [Hylaeus volcanicus]XP_053978496.1 uncharacterized protein LOC128876288 [Hylaeus volcanicus]XP_053978505.1 uncharacterized protein LOC128876288 [Hylaeus volcanicus]XP_053978514.1 uncharacterized protein LOC128876288 [Hylaeus volcanicus]
MKEKGHIDDAQTATVDEHMKLIYDDRSVIDSNFIDVTPDDLPEWFDEKLFKMGQAFYMENLLGLVTGNVLGLLAILVVPDITEVLTFTRKSSTISLSFKRYARTAFYIYNLFRTDMLKNESKWFEMLNIIRRAHTSASNRHVDDGRHGIYMKDMAITQFGFIGYVFACPEKIGLSHCTIEQKAGFNHFWRVTSYLLGIPNRLNICRKTVAETTQLCKRISHDIIKKHLETILPDSERLVTNAIQGLWYIDPFLNSNGSVATMYKLAGAEYKKPLGWISCLNMKLREWNFYLYSAPYIGVAVRAYYNYFLAFLFWSMEHYPLLARIAFGKDKSNLCLSSN